MKIVIAGGGRIGGALAARLVVQRHTVTVIDRDREVCERLFEEEGVLTVCGDASDVRTLDRAGLRSADVAAAVLARDSDNLAFAMLARSLSSARVMVRMLDNNYRDAYRLAGVRDATAEADVVVDEMASAIDFPEVGGLLPIAGGHMVLFEFPIGGSAPIANRTVAQVRADPGFPRDCLFVGLLDASGRVELPSGTSRLVPGATALLVARRDQLASAVDYLAAQQAAVSEPAVAFVAALRGVDFLAALSDAEIHDLARNLQLLRRAPGETVFRPGEPAEAFYVVLGGEVALVDEGGAVLERVGPNGFFGEIALLTGKPRSRWARAEAETELAVIGREAFSRVVMANPGTALAISRLVGDRLGGVPQQQVPARRSLFRWR